MFTGIVIPADEALPLEKLEVHGIQDMQKAVGGLFEVLDTQEPAASVWSNEEGLILDLPVNRRASILLWLGNKAHRGYTTLRGDCLVTGNPDDQGQTTSVSPELLALFFDTESIKFEVQTADSGTAWSSNQQRFDNYFDAAAAALSLSGRWFLVTAMRVVPA